MSYATLSYSSIKPNYSKSVNSNTIHINNSNNTKTMCGLEIESMQTALEIEIKKFRKCKKCIHKREYIF